jgi:hypothetical protein
MGGNALKIAKTRRYNKKEYYELCNEFNNKLPFKHSIPKSYRNKDSFGDLDVLIHSGSYGKIYENKPIIEYIRETFNPQEIHKNSHVTSFDHKDFQIDFIMVKPKYWESSKTYFEHNDNGNFMGRIAYKMGFRYGDFGLRLVYLHEDGGKKFKYDISTDSDKIFSFLGFDYERYEKGFDKLEEIFEFVIDSKYFNARLFDYDQLNHQNRTRNKKRTNYRLFLDYVSNIDKSYEYKNKDYYVNKAEEFFGIDLADKIASWRKEVEREKEAHEHFNGNLIMKHYLLTGKELGVAIYKFKEFVKKEFPATNFHNYVINTDQETMWEMFEMVNNVQKTIEYD